MRNTNDYKVKIVTGDYHLASKEQHEMLENLLGAEAEYKYEIYFHWYNVIHELGHAIMMFNCAERPHPAEEEQMVNNFAYAYWSHYGEPKKIEKLREIVNNTLPNLWFPTPKIAAILNMQRRIGELKNSLPSIIMVGFSTVVFGLQWRKM